MSIGIGAALDTNLIVIGTFVVVGNAAIKVDARFPTGVEKWRTLVTGENAARA